MTFDNPDFVTYAQAYAGHGPPHHADGGSGADAGGGLQCRGMSIVAVPIDYSENTRVLVEELRGRARRRPTWKPNSNRMESSDHAASRTGL